MLLLGFDRDDNFFQQMKITSNEFKNHLIQILTGEGKSITLGMGSTILAMIGYNIDVVCYSSYLSERDYNSFKHIFEAFKLVDKIKYGTFTEIADSLLVKGGDIC
jgi:preprotein translocase subunit SecA